MKKTLILASLLAFTMTAAQAAPGFDAPPPGEFKRPPMDQGMTPPPPPPEHKKMDKKANFEKKLKLTEEQKAKAKEIRLKGREEMQPIAEKIKAKAAEMKKVKESRIAIEDQEKQLATLREEMKVLHKEAKTLRIKNMQEFESILTPKQKKTLNKMKEQAKKDFKKQHKQGPKPPMPEPRN